MGGACCTRGRDEKCIKNFSRKTCKEYTIFFYTGVDGRILKCTLNLCGVIMWTGLI
jgi:hypothetical protein